MGVEINVIDKSSNISNRIESDLLDIMKKGLDARKDCDYVVTQCQREFGGSWILFYYKPGSDNSDFGMFFAFKSLKWIKFKARETHTFTPSSKIYCLFQISE